MNNSLYLHNSVFNSTILGEYSLVTLYPNVNFTLVILSGIILQCILTCLQKEKFKCNCQKQYIGRYVLTDHENKFHVLI